MGKDIVKRFVAIWLAVLVVVALVGGLPGAQPTTAQDSLANTEATIAALQTQVARTNATIAALQTQVATPSGATPASGPALLALTGSGTNTTPRFIVSGDWDLTWRYDCTTSPMMTTLKMGLFEIEVETGSGELSIENQPVIQTGLKAAGTEHYHHGGTFYLQVMSYCDWSVRVTNAGTP